jgi:cobalt-zinc-cadmium efflux system membrane fusion protein
MSESIQSRFYPLSGRYGRRFWISILAAAALAGVLWFGLLLFGGTSEAPNRTQRAPIQSRDLEVELTENQVASLKFAFAAEATFSLERSAVGNIDFNQNMLVQVFTPNPGRIILAFANVGDRVRKGQILFAVDSPDLLTAESNLIQAAGVLTLQNANLKRLTETQRSGGGAQKDVDQARSDQQTAEGNLRAALDIVRIFGKTDPEIDQIIQSRKADATLIVRSPIDGIVTQRTAAPGLYVQPGNAPAPFTVSDTSTMWMVANVVESDAPLFRVGQPIKVRLGAYPERIFTGKVSVVGAQVDPATRRMLVRSDVQDPDHVLRAGMFANFTIEYDEPIRATAVPSTGVVREGDGSMSVWVTRNRRQFERRIIKSGLQQDGLTQILDGLARGELVVTDGAVFVSNKASGGSIGD